MDIKRNGSQPSGKGAREATMKVIPRESNTTGRERRKAT